MIRPLRVALTTRFVVVVVCCAVLLALAIGELPREMGTIELHTVAGASQ